MAFSPQEYQRALARRSGLGAPGDSLRAQADVLDSMGEGVAAAALRSQAAALDGAAYGQPPSPGLSSNAKIGIAVGATSLVGTAIYALWPKKRRNRRR